ncbi:MAG: alpha-amylase family glycosyl hydrolase, partial [Candidatus Hodarchaeales archaeon]
MDKIPWWKTAVIYQIYPRSFADTSGNGIGDLRGIIDHLDYLNDDTSRSLGVDAIWLSPIFPSPQYDYGYDVSDYTGIDPVYGTMQDFEELLTEAHSRGIRILLDLVLNHTSHEHSWFEESRSSRDNPKRDWYVWHDGHGRKGQKPPNNWKAYFGGSVWQWDAATEQFYLHHFLKEQPDLNYQNPDVRRAVLDVVRFWLDKGVDGFRLDVIHMLYHDEKLRNNPRSWQAIPSDMNSSLNFQNHLYDVHQPQTHEFLKELRSLAGHYDPPRVLLGEILGPPSITKTYYGKNDELHLVFNFIFMSRPFKAQQFQWAIDLLEQSIPDPLWPAYVLSNHDRPRAYSRYKCKKNELKAKLLATLLLTLRGTPVIYYGEEVGMANANVPKKQMHDPMGLRYWPLSGIIRSINRDGCRTPMQWANEPNSGFARAGVSPWLPLSKNWPQNNVEAQLDDPKSLLSYYRELLWLRKEETALKRGSLAFRKPNYKQLLAYERKSPDETVLVTLNFGRRALSYKLEKDIDERQIKLLLSSFPIQNNQKGELVIPGYCA